VLVDELLTSCRTVVSFGTVVQPLKKTVPSVSNKAKIRMDFIVFEDGPEREWRVAEVQAFSIHNRPQAGISLAPEKLASQTD
jgi:hypothetical protein